MNFLCLLSVLAVSLCVLFLSLFSPSSLLFSPLHLLSLSPSLSLADLLFLLLLLVCCAREDLVVRKLRQTHNEVLLRLEVWQLDLSDKVLT